MTDHRISTKEPQLGLRSPSSGLLGARISHGLIAGGSGHRLQHWATLGQQGKGGARELELEEVEGDRCRYEARVRRSDEGSGHLKNYTIIMYVWVGI